MTKKTYLAHDKMPVFVVEVYGEVFVIQANSSQDAVKELLDIGLSLDNYSIKRVDNLIADDKLTKLIQKIEKK